jgi:hypothetical protein
MTSLELAVVRLPHAWCKLHVRSVTSVVYIVVPLIRALSLNTNQLTGTIPDVLTNLTQLS